MKIVHISEYCHAESVGGTERYVLELIRGLSARGVGGRIGWLTGLQRAPFESAQVMIHPLPAPSMRVDTPPDGLGAAAVRLLDQENPALLHFHTFGLAEAEIARIARSREIPCIFTYHSPGWTCRREDLLIWGGQEPCDGEVRVLRCSACKIQEHFGGPAWAGYAAAAMSWPMDLVARGSTRADFRRRTCFLSDTRRFAQALREFLRHCAWTCSCSEWGRRVLIANGARTQKISVMAQGVGEDFVAACLASANSLRRRAPETPMTIGYMGRVVPVKGVDMLAEAFAQIPGDDLRLKIFGWEGEDAAGAFTKKLANLARRDSRIGLLPKLPLSAMADAYCAVDLVAVPSVWPETGPLVVFEALQMGIPVFGSNRLGHPELLEKGGAVISPNTRENWRAALQNAVDEFRAGRWEKRVEQVRAVSPVRTMLDVVGEMLALYQSVRADAGVKSAPTPVLQAEFAR
jgi:glycosyltransferase involved in cell wall biosynthesis